MQPLALVLYEKLLPGTQVVNRLQDLNYRVQTLSDPNTLVTSAAEAKPLIVLADLDTKPDLIFGGVTALKRNDATSHVPVIGFSHQPGADLQARALAAGFTLLVSEAAILSHLEQCLERALQVE